MPPSIVCRTFPPTLSTRTGFAGQVVATATEQASPNNPRSLLSYLHSAFVFVIICSLLAGPLRGQDSLGRGVISGAAKDTGGAVVVNSNVVSRSKQYAALQAQLQRGWNTWDTTTVASEVLLPQGLEVRLGLERPGHPTASL